MAELIHITLADGKTEVLNLDYVVRIRAIDDKTSEITVTDGIRSAPMAVQGDPGHIATSKRLQG